MSASLPKLEAKIGHKFKDLKLLERAVTHRSWAYENLAGETDGKIHEAENESLEFIGDSVIGLIVAEQLFLSESESQMEKEQIEIMHKVDKLNPFVRWLGAASGLLILVIAGLAIYQGLNQVQ